VIPRLKKRAPKKIQLLNDEDNEILQKTGYWKNLDVATSERKIADISGIGKLRKLPSKVIESKDFPSPNQPDINQNDSIIMNKAPLQGKKKTNTTITATASPRSLFLKRQQSKEEMKRLNVFDEYHNVS
jgi:hypothetical protein